MFGTFLISSVTTGNNGQRIQIPCLTRLAFTLQVYVPIYEPCKTKSIVNIACYVAIMCMSLYYQSLV